MKSVLQLIHKSVGTVAEDDLQQPLDQLGIDSIDLVDLRVNLDHSMGFEIPDADWLGFNSFHDIIRYYEGRQGSDRQQSELASTEAVNTRRYQINMPQMALSALSENWLLKEIGDFHWNVLCHGLGVDSSRIQDELGNRLYATFVRIRLQCSQHLQHFRENENLHLHTRMTRYGNGMYFSDLTAQGDAGKHIRAELMTTFSYRDAENNKSLKKGQPYGVENTIEAHGALPQFGQEYRLLRKGERQSVELLGESFAMTDDSIFEHGYTINPYLDLNGVNLLYFAAYPTINDDCEAQYFNQHHADRIRDHWAKEAYTLARDIYYLNNCDLNDSIWYRLHEATFLPGRRVRIHSTLVRESDGQPLARIFTIKEMVG